ncbi:putative quinol monooxygenase [Clostridium sp. UBA4548]|uniref:putative quinol monooxygenase n=1 Tax=Clostridium sp. UBA4548 TaxID=1946361 RepID=UPI0025C70629|nr:putative quinol monooxygenase [Clostridium sp. UBA4548]
MVKVVAKNFIQQDKINEAIELYRELVEKTRKEQGCIKYELYQDTQNPTILTMVEEWENRDFLEKHFKTEHFTRIVPMIGKFLAGDKEVNIYNKII